MFTGRTTELKILENAYTSKKGELIVLYGRQRIGKSSLIYQYAKEKEFFFSFEGLEGEQSRVQIQHMAKGLEKQKKDLLLASMNFRIWEGILSYLTERVISEIPAHRKAILFFDELKWMAASRNRLISLLKYYWDNYWEEKRIMLILCGSTASFMVRNVIRSRALYGRITVEMLLKGLAPHEATLLFRGKRNHEEIMNYLLLFGGVPKYLEEIKLNRSFHQNINQLCFFPQALMVQEATRIFYNQFKESQTYLRIVSLTHL
ncbi:MAG: AAA family ATPase [Kiritimatiellae bacterium]|nr:AAA family ATPase [Kiritimatiellia bacterium]